MATDVHGNVATSAVHPTIPSTCRGRGNRRCSRLLGEGRDIGDQVVDQHAEGGEADRPGEIGNTDDAAHHHGHRHFGMVRHLKPRMHCGQPARKISLSGHGQQVRPIPAIKASRAPSEAAAPPTRTTTSVQSPALTWPTAASGVAVAAVPAGPSTASTVTATTAYSVTVMASAITIARGMVRAGSTTSSPRVAIRA